MPGAPERWQTERLVAEPLGAGHFAELDGLHRDERVMATLGGVRDAQATRATLENASAHWRAHGFGYWLLRDRETQRFAGRGGLQRVEIEGRPEVEVGYAFLPAYWGRGLASEMVQRCQEIALRDLRLRELVGFTLPDNRPSRRVLEKAGFVHERNGPWKGLPHAFYRFVPPPGSLPV